MEESNTKRVKEGIECGSKMMVAFMRQSEQRSNSLVAQLIPLLTGEVKHKIIENSCCGPSEEWTEEELLTKHLKRLIFDFDCNIHYLEEKEMPALAEVINRKPLISFFTHDD